MHRAARLLVVDDEAELLAAVSEVLGGAGFEVAAFTDPAAALAAVPDGRFDLLLSDMAMPGMGGAELLRAACAADRDLVGLLMTGQGTAEAEREAAGAGAVELVRKPFRAAQLVGAVERALGLVR